MLKCAHSDFAHRKFVSERVSSGGRERDCALKAVVLDCFGIDDSCFSEGTSKHCMWCAVGV